MNILLLIGVFVLLFFGVKRQQSKEEFFSLEVAKGLQGVSAIFIILHHGSQLLNRQREFPGAINILENAGVFFVGVFFFCSGYGLLKSLKTKENYLKGFLKKRYLTIFLPYYGINLIYLVYFLSQKTSYTTTEWIQYVTGIRMINTNAWYVISIAFFYLIFYLAFRFFKKKWLSYSFLVIVMVLYIVTGIYRGHGDGSYFLQGEWWYITCPLLVVGMLFVEFEEKILAFVHKLYYPLLILLGASFYYINIESLKIQGKYGYWAEYRGGDGIKERFLTLPIHVLTVFLFVMTVVVFTMKFKVGNRLSIFLGEISIEIYLIHQVFYMMFRSSFLYIKNQTLFLTAVIFAGIITAALLHFLFERIKQLGRKKDGTVSCLQENKKTTF